MKNKLLLVLGGVVALIIVGALLVVLLVDVNQYRDVIEARLGEQLGREVTLGEMSLGLFPPRFEVDRTAVAEAPGFGDRPDFVSTDRLAVRIGLLSLLSGDIDVRSLELNQPVVELVRNADDVWNFSTLGSASDAGPAEPSEEADDREFVLGRLSIIDGQIAVSDLGEGTRTVYDHVDVTLRNFAPGQPFSLEVAAHLPGEGAQLLQLSGNGGPIDADAPLDTPFDGTLTLDEVGVEGLGAFLDTDMLSSSNGSLSGSTTIDHRGEVTDATGSLVFEDVRFNGVDVGYPIELTYDGQAQLGVGLYTIERATLVLGSTPLSVSGWLNTETVPVTVDLNFQAGDVSIEEMARLASAFGVAFPPEAEVAGNLDMNVRVTGPAADPALNGTLSGRDLVISGTSVRQPVEIPALALDLSPTRVRSNEFEVRSGTTRATASFTLSDYASEVPGVDARVEAPGATLPDIQAIASAYGFTGLDRIEGQGAMDLDIRASGPLDSEADSADLMRALNGAINLDFSPLTILGVNATSQLGSIGGFNAGGAAGDVTELARLAGLITITNGIAQTQNLHAELPIGNVAVAGSADLASETLDLDLAAVLSAAFSESVGGTGIGGYLRTALANSQGELVLPVRVTGTFDDPQFAPDTQAITDMQVQRLLPTLDDPASLWNALTGRTPTAGEEGEAAESGTSEPEDVIRGILGGIFGGNP